jgi:hypothetical protein
MPLIVIDVSAMLVARMTLRVPKGAGSNTCTIRVVMYGDQKAVFIIMNPTAKQ